MKRTSSMTAASLLTLSAGLFMSAPAPERQPPGLSPLQDRAIDSVVKTTPARRSGVSERMAALAALAWCAFRLHRYPRPGWSVRHGQRLARKRRNVARHRAAARRNGRA